jgi:hypothetical protein
MCQTATAVLKMSSADRVDGAGLAVAAVRKKTATNVE